MTRTGIGIAALWLACGCSGESTGDGSAADSGTHETGADGGAGAAGQAGQAGSDSGAPDATEDSPGDAVSEADGCIDELGNDCCWAAKAGVPCGWSEGGADSAPDSPECETPENRLAICLVKHPESAQTFHVGSMCGGAGTGASCGDECGESVCVYEPWTAPCESCATAALASSCDTGGGPCEFFDCLAAPGVC